MHSPRSSTRREQSSSATPPQQREPLPAPIPSPTTTKPKRRKEKREKKRKGKGQTTWTPGQHESVTEIQSEYKSNVYRWRVVVQVSRPYLHRSCMHHHKLPGMPTALNRSSVPTLPLH